MTTNLKRPTLALLTLAAALLGGCASTPQAKTAADKDLLGYITYNRGGRRMPVIDVTRVTTRELVSADVQISRVDDGFRGIAGKELIEMRLEPDLVLGTRGGFPIELHLSHKGDLLLAKGLYGGKLVELRFPRAAPVAAKSAPSANKRPVTNSSPLEMRGYQGPAQYGQDTAVSGSDSSNDTVGRMFERLPENEAVAMLAVVYLR